MSQPLIQVDQLTIGYHNREGTLLDVVRDVSLTIHAGETLGLVGESGCGKTTLALALLGYLRGGSRVVAGHVRFRGQDILRLPTSQLERLRRQSIGYVPQHANQALTPTMRVGEQLVEVLELRGGAQAHAVWQRAHELFVQVRLPQPETLLRRYPHELSGGQQQRAAIALALARQPELLILDEPTTGLDTTTQAHLIELLHLLSRETHTAMVCVSHDFGVIAHVSSRVAVMYAGEVVEVAPAPTLFRSPRHPYTRGLLTSLPRLAVAGIPAALPGHLPRIGTVHQGCAFAPRCTSATQLCHEQNPDLITITPPAQMVQQVRCHHWQQFAAHPSRRLLPRMPSMAAPQETPALSIRDVRISYARPTIFARLRGSVPPPTVDNVSLDVQRGETLALVGESGSGKTTILRTIAGLKMPAAGQIAFGTQNITGLVEQRSRTIRRAIQIIFQNPDASLNPRQTIEQILSHPLRLYFGLDHATRHQRAQELLAQVRLGAHYLARFPGQLSGGEKQRVAIARAFAAEPEVILCDEIIAALDVSVQAAILELLAEYQAQRGITYLFVTHNLSVVRAFADRVAVLYQGRLCEVGLVAAIYAPPWHPYTETLLRAIPEPTPGSLGFTPAADQPESAPPSRGCPFQRRCPRHLGRICDEVTPPWQTAAGGHHIACHIPLAELQATQSPLRPAAINQHA